MSELRTCKIEWRGAAAGFRVEGVRGHSAGWVQKGVRGLGIKSLWDPAALAAASSLRRFGI